MDAIRPKYRFKLKGTIIASGYKSASAFCKITGIGDANLNCIINGWKYPSPLVQFQIREGLGITTKELKELL